MAGTARKARKGRKKERSRNDFSPPGDFVRLLLLDFAREAGVPKLLSELFDLFLGHILAQDDCRIAAESFQRILVNLDIRCFFRRFQFNGDLLLLGALKGVLLDRGLPILHLNLLGFGSIERTAFDRNGLRGRNGNLRDLPTSLAVQNTVTAVTDRGDIDRIVISILSAGQLGSCLRILKILLNAINSCFASSLTKYSVTVPLLVSVSVSVAGS